MIPVLNDAAVASNLSLLARRSPLPSEVGISETEWSLQFRDELFLRRLGDAWPGT